MGLSQWYIRRLRIDCIHVRALWRWRWEGIQFTKIEGNIAGIILAAGEGRRLGGNKALLQIKGVSFLELIAGAMLDSGIDPIVAVLGAEVEAVKKASSALKVNFAINKNWQSGQFSSLKIGLHALPKNVPGVMISLVDHPLIKIKTYKLLCHVFMENSDKIILPMFAGRHGHPVIVPHRIIEEIIPAQDNMSLKEIIRNHADLVFEQLVDDPGILQDIDTENEFRKIKGS